jgi:Carboxypeptidase regulatory-like domain
MKYSIALLFTIFVINTGVYAQPGTGRIYGVVKDTVQGIFLESATIIIYKPDSSVALFKITDKNGRFDISGVPVNAKYELAISFAGYNDFRLPFTMNAPVKKIDTIYLQLKSSNEVVVTSVAPIRMNGDTLEINPAAFKMSNDAVAEDLLNKVPGVVIWADGSITMNGKAIPKVLVDGKPFLGSSDHRIATQNLPKNIIDKIQVYNQVDVSSELTRSQMTDAQAPKDSLLTMDIKLKADKKNGYFGKYGGGYGTGNRYQADAALQLYNKQSAISVGGGSNNINAEIAGLNDIQRETTFRNNYATYRSRSNFGRSGINRVVSPGLQFTHSFSQNDNERSSNRLTGGYDYDNNLGNIISQTYQERYLKDGDQIINSDSKNKNQSEQHAIRFSYNKSLDYNKRFTINASGRTSASIFENSSSSVIDNRNGVHISDRISKSEGGSNSKSLTSTVNYTNFDYDNPLKAFDANISFTQNNNNSGRNENSVYNFYSVNGTQNTTIKRRYQRESNSASLNGTISYNGLKRLLFGRFNFFGIDMRTSQNITYRKDDEVNSVFDIDASQKENTNKYLSYSEGASAFQYIPSLSLNKSFNKWSSRKFNYYGVGASVNKQFIQEENSSSRINRNLNRHFTFTRLTANANYSRQVTDKYRFNGGMNYDNGFTYPTINQIAPVVDSINLYSLYKGGLNLVNSRNHNVSGNINFSTITPKKPSQFSVSINGNINNALKPFVDSSVNLRDTIRINGADSVFLNGKQMRYTINGNRRYNSYFGYAVSFSRKIKANQVQVQYNGNVSTGMTPGYIDNIYTIINSANFSQSLRFTYYYKTFLIAGVGANSGVNNSRQTGYRNSSFNTRTFSGEFNVTVNATKDASLSSNISYSKNNGIVKPVTIWNANASYRFLKSKQAEVRFTATDILKQFRNISYYANPDGVTSSVSNGLQQYFMLSFSYFPRKFGLSGSNTTRRGATEIMRPGLGGGQAQGVRGGRRG